MSLVSVYLNLKFNLEIVTENLHKNQSWHRNPRRNHLQTNYSRNSHESLCRANKCFYRFFIVSTTQPLCKTIKAFSHPSAAPSALLIVAMCVLNGSEIDDYHVLMNILCLTTVDVRTCELTNLSCEGGDRCMTVIC